MHTVLAALSFFGKYIVFKTKKRLSTEREIKETKKKRNLSESGKVDYSVIS